MTDETRNEQLEKLVTPEFLSTLTEVAKLFGWDGDYIEIAHFVDELHSIKQIQFSLGEPYKIEN